MIRRLSPVPIQVHYSSDAEPEKSHQKKPKRGRRLRNTSPSPSRFLRVVTRNANANGNGPHTVRRSHSYHDTSELGLEANAQAGDPCQPNASGPYMAATTSSAAAVPSNSSGSGREAKQFLDVQDPRARKPSGGSLHDMFSLGLRFGGKGNKDKKKKDSKKHAELPSPVAQSPNEELTFYSIPPDTLRQWRKSLDIVLQDPAGCVLFHRHLNMEHSMENMQFCKEVDRFKTLPDNKLEKEAKAIAAKYIGEDTPKALNIDSALVKNVEAQLKHPHRDMFNEARQTVYDLMATDTFRRFKTSPDFVKASQRDQSSCT